MKEIIIIQVISLWACSPSQDNSLSRSATADHCLATLRTLALTGDNNEGEMSTFADRLEDLAAQLRNPVVPGVMMVRGARPGARWREDRDERMAVTVETDSDCDRDA